MVQLKYIEVELKSWQPIILAKYPNVEVILISELLNTEIDHFNIQVFLPG